MEGVCCDKKQEDQPERFQTKLGIEEKLKRADNGRKKAKIIN